MAKYTVSINEVQSWTYQYVIESSNSEDALHKAESLHFEGVQSYDNWINETEIKKIWISEVTE